MSNIQVKDRQFKPYLSEFEILERVNTLAEKISEDMDGLNPLFVCVLNGSFMFASDLLKHITTPCEISFVKVASYTGMNSVGHVKELIGFGENVKGRHVVLVEDIVDTGETIEMLTNILKEKEVASYRVAALLLKPESYKRNIPIKYRCFEIPNDFVVGYGLDYDGYGRNLPSIYSVVE